MAEFCNKCAEKYGSPEVDVDVYRIHGQLNKNEMTYTMCEGCGMVAIKKDVTGALMVGYAERNRTNIKWLPYD